MCVLGPMALTDLPSLAPLAVVTIGVPGALVATVLYMLGRIVYNIFFHPLRAYPGPRLWAAFRLPWTFHNLRGDLARQILALHTQYGPVVRIAPDELSYTTGAAWKKIYGQRHPAEFSKCLDGRGIAGPNMKNAKVSGIVTAPLERHSYLRRAIAPAFSDRALREQEEYLQLYTDKLIAQLQRTCRGNQGGAVEDMQRWYSLMAFDIVSDLAFGQPAGCLDNADQPWLQVIGQRAKSIPWFQLGMYYNVDGWMNALAPKKSIEARQKHMQLTAAKVTARLDAEKAGDRRKDFMSYILGNKDDSTPALSKMELVMIASSFIVAGSGTSASALAGITYFLARKRDKYARLTEEVRGAFADEKEITMDGTTRLPYLRAVIDEGMRLYPPSPSTFPRFVPGKGEIIDGLWVPGGTAVGIHQLSAGRSESNFRRAEEFLPERWLGGEEFAQEDRAAVQPFSYGPRNCIGQNMAYAEMRLILAKLLWSFDFELTDDAEKWLTEQKVYLIWDKIPLMVKLWLRS